MSAGLLPLRTRAERLAFWLIVCLGGAMRVAAFLRYRFDSDEPQHLHVAWGWTAGLVQYRDLFDNHAPLFHLATAPLLRLAGERADVLLLMRGWMIPLWLLVVAATYVLGRRLYDARTGLWAAVLLAIFPPFFLKSLEYRTDNFWTAIWAAMLLVLTGGPLTATRLFVLGLLIGTAFCVSMKTILLVVTLALAGAIAWWMRSERRDARDVVRLVLPTLAGAAVMPALLASYFASLGAWRNLVYCVFTFNELIAQTHRHVVGPRLVYPVVLAGVLAVAWRLRERSTAWRYFFLVAMAIFTITLGGFWILISPRDFLPIMPVAAIFAAALVQRHRHFVAIVLALAAVAFLHIGYYTEWLDDETDEQITMLNQVLHLTRPGEPLMDYKGETVFRRRPYYYILEMIGRSALQRGLIADTIPEDMQRARCYVAQADGRFWPPRAKQFLAEHFIDVGRLRVAGHVIEADGAIDIAIPGEYVVVHGEGLASGTLDGTPLTGPRMLAAGRHRFVRADPAAHVTYVWAPAFARGFSPYHLRDREF